METGMELAGPLFRAGGEAGSTLPAKIENAAPESLDIFSKAVVLHLQFRRLGTSRALPSGQIARIEGESGDNTAARHLIKASRIVLESPELDAIEKHDGQTERYIDKLKSGPAFANQGGFHLLSLAVKDEADRWLTQRQAQRLELIETFIEKLPVRIAETRAALGPCAPSAFEYPTREMAREAFSVTASYMTFGYTDEDAAEAWRQTALFECRQTLSVAFAGIMQHIVERLTPGEEGKAKTFRDFKKFDEFVSNFETRDLTNYAELRKLVEEARELMTGTNAKELRKNDGLRAAVVQRATEIRNAVDALVVDKPSRQYNDDEE